MNAGLAETLHGHANTASRLSSSFPTFIASSVHRHKVGGCDKAGVDVEVCQNVCKRGSLTTKERTGRRRDREHEKEAEY